MTIGHRKPGARALLFDRLARGPSSRGDSGEKGPLRQTYSEAGLRRSVLEQLKWLLNARVVVDFATLDARIREGRRTTIDYGIPDLSGYSAGDAAAMARLSAHLAQTIAWFEPRLSEPKVKLGPVDGRNQRLAVDVSGTITAGMTVVPVNFRIEVGAAEDAPDAN